MSKLTILPKVLLFCQFLGLMAKDLDWWETTVIYQIYPRSFKDSDGDGCGDLNGIYEKLDYIKDTGFETIWIQPFYESPMADMGYDVKNFRKIDPLFGTMDDFKRLIKGIHDRGMKLVMDFVPNHVSDESEWFKRSVERQDPYTDYFIWRDGKRINETHSTYPNNWHSIFGGSGWTWNEKRKQYYYSVFAPKQPDLNFHNQKLRREMENILRFWLDLGVDGFRVDAIEFLIESPNFEDEPVVKVITEGNDYMSLNHIYTRNLMANTEVTHEWRMVLDQYKQKDGKTRLLCVEDYSPAKQLLRYLGNDTYPNVHTPFYFPIVFYDYKKKVEVLDRLIHNWVDIMPNGRLPNWVFANHDNYRISSLHTPNGVDALNMVQLLLPGLASVYYGSEIGLEDSLVRTDQRVDPLNGGNDRTDSRDPSRGPMPWDDSKNAGFTMNERPWLPIHPSYWHKNVKTELQEPNSHLKIFKQLIALRKTPTIKYGTLQTFVMSDWLYMFTRRVENEIVAVVVNLGSESEKICTKDNYAELPDSMFVYTGSLNSGFSKGDKIELSHKIGDHCAELRPKAGLVLSTTSSSAIQWTYSLCVIIVASGLNLLGRRGPS